MSPVIETDPAPNTPQRLSDSRAAGAAPTPKSWASRLLAVVFVALLASHVYVNIGPHVLYQADETLTEAKVIPIFPVYLRGSGFLRPFLKICGGPIEYVGASLSQYYSTPISAAAVLVLVAVGLFLLTGSVLSMMGGQAGSVLRFVPAVLLVVIWNRYTFVLADQLALLGALLVVCVYHRLPDKAALRAAVMLPAIAVFYYLAGGLCLLAALMCGFYELLANRRRIGWAYFVVGAVAPVVGNALAGESMTRPHLRLAGLTGGTAAMVAWIGLYAFFVVLTVGLALRKRWAVERTGPAGSGRLRGPIRWAALFVLGAVVALVTLDRDVRTFRRLCSYHQRQDWVGVVLQARELTKAPSEMYAGNVCRMLNRALFETGRMGFETGMGVEMFAYPQARLGSLLFAPSASEPYKSDTLLELGAVDITEVMALRSDATWPNRPYVLRLLTKIAIAKDDMGAARSYLRTLLKDPVHRPLAEDLLAKIDTGYDFGADGDIARVRSVMIEGLPGGPASLRGILEVLADKNPDDRMAFEYLMASYLLAGELEPFAERVGRVGQFDYPYLPPHYAEAILLRAVLAGQTPDYEGLPEKDPTILVAGPMFTRLYAQNKHDMPALLAALTKVLPASYFRYYFALQLMSQPTSRPPAHP